VQTTIDASACAIICGFVAHCPGGEIGRRRGLKIPRRKACRFDSGLGHQRKTIENQWFTKRPVFTGLLFFLDFQQTSNSNAMRWLVRYHFHKVIGFLET